MGVQRLFGSFTHPAFCDTGRLFCIILLTSKQYVHVPLGQLLGVPFKVGGGGIAFSGLVHSQCFCDKGRLFCIIMLQGFCLFREYVYSLRSLRNVLRCSGQNSMFLWVSSVVSYAVEGGWCGCRLFGFLQAFL